MEVIQWCQPKATHHKITLMQAVLTKIRADMKWDCSSHKASLEIPQFLLLTSKQQFRHKISYFFPWSTSSVLGCTFLQGNSLNLTPGSTGSTIPASLQKSQEILPELLCPTQIQWCCQQWHNTLTAISVCNTPPFCPLTSATKTFWSTQKYSDRC